jgi:hypothetical protein
MVSKKWRKEQKEEERGMNVKRGTEREGGRGR